MRKQFFKSWLLSILLLAMMQIAMGQYWQQQVNYDISVWLNDTAHTMDGQMTMEYINHSPDTLSVIWMHVWPNAYKNDKTAFSEQMLLYKKGDFYFSNAQQKGYINRLNFQIDGQTLYYEDHPRYIDVLKLILPKPLLPGESVNIGTSFHIKIPHLFSRLGHDGQFYSISQWYPKAALYDREGWHPMPYLEYGEYYNNFGHYHVRITLPSNYAVAATGVLQNEEEINWLKTRNALPDFPTPAAKKKELFKTQKEPPRNFPSSSKVKTLFYKAENVTDFAWFADKRFIVKHDTVQLEGHHVDVWNFVLPQFSKKWEQSMTYTKRSVRYYASKLGNYAYPQISMVSAPDENYGGMEYPMIAMLNADESGKKLDMVIAHEVGHNWFQAAIATNERDHAWMDEGMNTYLENRYTEKFYSDSAIADKGLFGKKFPADESELSLNTAIGKQTDQPIATTSEEFTSDNHSAMVYGKAALWMKKLETEIGKDAMDRLLRAYYSQWKYKHPGPEDFKLLAERVCACSLAGHFNLLHQTGPLVPLGKRKTRLTAFFNFTNTDKYHYVGISPVIGFNNYDKLELGMLVHNYNIPAQPFQFGIAPMIGTGSKKLIGIGRLSYALYPKSDLQKMEIYANASRFNFDDGSDINDEKIYRSFSRFVPGVYFEWKKKFANSTLKKYADIRAYVIGEQQFEHINKPAPADSLYYDHLTGTRTTFIPQITLGIADTRYINPWSAELQVQQVEQIVRSTVTAKYFLNYNEKKQGLSVRLFAGKIFYTQQKTDLLRSQNSRYHFTMYGPNGFQDYTYSNVFAERSQSPQIWGRQIMIRDGGFKYRSDYSAVLPGLKTNSIDFFDNWLAAMNFEVDIPDKVNPLSLIKLPLKVFADIGTSASPWTAGSDQSKFLYSIGLQLQLFKLLNIYYPIVQSSEFKEPNSVNDPNRIGGPNWWQKRLTFSVDVERLKQIFRIP